MLQPGRSGTYQLIATIGATLILVLTSQTVMAFGGTNIVYSGGSEPSASIASSVNSTMGTIEEAYPYGPSGETVLYTGNITPFNGSDIVNFTVSVGPGGSWSHGTPRRLDLIQKDIVQKINKGNQPVSDEGRNLIGNKSGPRRIDQICAIYDFLVDDKNWTYVSDWLGGEQLQYSNNTLSLGKAAGGLGKGDCDDFAILLCALAESVGAAPRILFADSPAGGHAYTEVYLGKSNEPGSNVTRMIRWLRDKYEVDEINNYTDPNNGDVWLNLDWWMDPNTSEELAKHPGGPFFRATEQYVVYPENSMQAKKPLNPVDMAPIAMFQVVPQVPTIGMNASFNASMSYDVDGNITTYKWDFGDGQSSDGELAVHNYSIAGPVRVNLTVTDDNGLNGSKSKIIQLNRPPVARFTFKPEDPMVNEPIWFDAGTSYDPEEGELSYLWDFKDNNGTAEGDRESHTFKNDGIFNVKLTVTDNCSAQNNISLPVRVSGARITNAKKDDPMPHFFDLIGDYSLFDANRNKSIWVFVKSDEVNSNFHPQTIDPCHPDNASMIKGKWETRITIGGSGDSIGYFWLIAALVDESADKEIKKSMFEWWCSKNLDAKGFPQLPDGVHETHRIRVKRHGNEWGSSHDISNIDLPPGRVEITSPNSSSGNILVNETTRISGNRNREAEHIWVLVHTIKDGKWYPQSKDNENNRGHVTNVLPRDWAPVWYIDALFNGSNGDPFELVVVLADPSADKFFNDFQMSCAKAVKPDGTKGNWKGLLTIELPPGIYEIDRIKVYLNKSDDDQVISINNSQDQNANSGHEESTNIADLQNSNEINISIIEPLESSILNVGQNISGIAKNIPSEKEIWLVVYSYKTDKYYPLGPRIKPNENGEWQFESDIIKHKHLEKISGDKLDLIVLLAEPNVFHSYFTRINSKYSKNKELGIWPLPSETKIYNQTNVTLA